MMMEVLLALLLLRMMFSLLNYHQVQHLKGINIPQWNDFPIDCQYKLHHDKGRANLNYFRQSQNLVVVALDVVVGVKEFCSLLVCYWYTTKVVGD